MTPSESAALAVLQALVVALPLFRGGRAPAAIVIGWVAIVALLAVTVKRRRTLPAPAIPGVTALAAFVALALATTVPLPPALVGAVAPATARLYAEALPGWPDGGGWTAWRSLALDPFGVWAELGRLALPVGVYVVAVGHAWSAEDDRVFARLLLALLAGGVVVATLGLVQQAAGVLPVVGTEALGGRASGPFVNPNHFAGWLEMTIPIALAYLVALAGRVRRRLARASASGRRIGVRAGRAWISALIVHQRRLWAPLFALAALALMATAHVASGSRAGVAALAIGLAVTGAGLAASLGRSGPLRRLLPAAIALGLAAAAAGAVVVWVQADAGAPVGDVDAVDPSLASRLGVALRARDLLGDHPVVGTGLGSWLHAFRPYQAPPADGGIWDHAHDDYLELAAETGAGGVALAVAFAVAVARAVRRRPGTALAPVRRPAEFEAPEWREALGDRGLLRWGLAGGVAAILVHSAVDFGLHLPAIQVAFMALLALLVSRGSVGRDAGRPARRTPALAALVAGLVVAAIFPLADALGIVRLSPARCLESADAALADTGDAGRALALVRRALDRSPADRDAHEMLATVLGPGPDGDAALARAIALAPWSTELRDRLAFRLWRRGEREAAAAALEESMFRSPYLETHGFLAPDGDLAGDTGDLVRVVVEGDTMPVRLAALEPALATAIRHGLERALEEAPAGEPRAAIVADLVTVLEAGEAWHDAAAVLEAEADPGADGATLLAHAARDHVKAGDRDAAERTLLAAVVRTPERGELYRQLAVDVYGARRDFETAERVLRAGERSAIDILPVYDGVTDVLSQREHARFEEAATGDVGASRP